MINEEEKINIIRMTVKPIVDLIESRLNTRLDMLATISTNNALENIPESIKKMREDESQKIRAVVQELRDLMAIIKALYPNG